MTNQSPTPKPTAEDKLFAALTAIILEEAMFNRNIDATTVLENTIAQARREGEEAEREACAALALKVADQSGACTAKDEAPLMIVRLIQSRGQS